MHARQAPFLLLYFRAFKYATSQTELYTKMKVFSDSTVLDYLEMMPVFFPMEEYNFLVFFFEIL